MLCFVPRRSPFQETVPDVSAPKMALGPHQSAGGKAGLGRAYLHDTRSAGRVLHPFLKAAADGAITISKERLPHWSNELTTADAVANYGHLTCIQGRLVAWHGKCHRSCLRRKCKYWNGPAAKTSSAHYVIVRLFQLHV